MSQTPRADFWFSLCLIIFGIAAFVESWRMPRLTDLGVDPVSAPGVTPGLLSIVIFGLGLSVFFRSIGAPPSQSKRDSSGWRRVLISLAMCLVYALGLVGQINFTLATALFVFVFTYLFSDGPTLGARRLAGAAVLAGVISISVTLLFERVFLVRLP